MSADNMICIQRRMGKWWVWMGFVSSDETYPDEKDVSFLTYEEASAYARGWLRGEYIVEYGIVELLSE